MAEVDGPELSGVIDHEIGVVEVRGTQDQAFFSLGSEISPRSSTATELNHLVCHQAGSVNARC